MANFRELLKATKAQIREMTPEQAEQERGRATFLDVREADEHDQGTIPGSVFIPRGNLETQVEGKISDKIDRVGERKVDSAKKTLTALNPDVNVVTYDVRLGADNILEIIDGYDLIVDGTDNFPTRYLVNDAALLKRIPVVHGSIFRFEGQATVFAPYVGPCYRCFLAEPPPADQAPSCAEAGVLGVLPGIIGSIQAMETIKLLLGLGDTLTGRLMAYDALEESFRV